MAIIAKTTGELTAILNTYPKHTSLYVEIGDADEDDVTFIGLVPQGGQLSPVAIAYAQGFGKYNWNSDEGEQ